MAAFHTDGAALKAAIAIPSPRPLFPEVRRFGLTHVAAPGALFCLSMLAIVLNDLDRRIARSWAYTAGDRWIGQDAWWANGVIHSGGHALVWLIGLCALLVWIVSFFSAKWRPRRRAALFIVLGLALTTGLVGLLKSGSQIGCPWNLQGFGGSYPYVTLFERIPEALHPAGCFPGAHSSSGFALMGFYFLLRDRRPRAARWALTGALSIGMLFAFGQEARGAHFFSHDLTSSVIAWYVLLALYLAMFPRTSRTDPAS